jgi:hypothetical protein
LNRATSQSFAAALGILISLCAASCAVPLAPGFRIVKESREIQFVPEQTPTLQVRVRYTLQNFGTEDLNYIDVTLPGERTYGRTDLHITVDGQEITPEPVPAERAQDEPDAVRIPFDPVWKRGQARGFSVEYAVASPQDRGTRITLSESSFHLGSRGGFPQLLPPKHALAVYPQRPDPTIYTIRVPSDFAVLARGKPKKPKRNGAETAYSFLLRRDDLAPYVVAGRYSVWPAGRADSGSTSFWTLQPLKESPQDSAAKIAAVWNILGIDFGPLDKNIQGPYIVESPDLRARVTAESGPAGAPFPAGALVNPAALAVGIDSDQFLDIVTRALAHDWFADQMYPTRDAALGMGEGLPEYAAIVVEAARGGDDARRRAIQRYLRRYDQARSAGPEMPLGVTMLTDPIAQRRIALPKAALFFVALEDACGPDATQGGLKHLVTVLRGQEVGYDDLRAALEQSSGKNLADAFRVWLNLPGIPDDFRSRYQPAGATHAEGD